MRSGWSSLSSRALDTAHAVSRRLPPGTLAIAVLVGLLCLVIANSTATAAWVPGSGGLARITLMGAVFMGVLALVPRVPAWPALLAGTALAPVAAWIAASGFIAAAHPGDPSALTAQVGLFLQRVGDGEASSDLTFYLFVICALFWVIGGWLAWCSLRWRQPLLGLAPGAVVFAANVLNFPTEQNGFVLFFLVLTLALLLWCTYIRSLDAAHRRRAKLSGDARWDFWESGVVVTMAVVVAAIFLPPLSTTDRTVDIENGAFRSWADLQQTLDHPVAVGAGAGPGSSVGFSSDVRLAGPTHKTAGVVFTYTWDGTYPGPRYFRGLNLAATSAVGGTADWHYAGTTATTAELARNASVKYADHYVKQAPGTFKVQMISPPSSAPDLIFYPGALDRIDRPVAVRSTAQLDVLSGPGAIMHTIDRVSGLGQAAGSGAYTLRVDYSTATQEDLRGAGTDYAAWLDPYRDFSGGSAAPGQALDPLAPAHYRSPAVLQEIRALALQVTAGADNPYDQATLIESYLRSRYQYTLTPNVPPTGTDPVEYFLFTTKQGYCEYFATAMGDMLRSLGIPTRLVNGYGAGTFDQKTGRNVVRESDAHTWVEVYFPTYGWIPFEPTPDGTYFPIPRGASPAACAGDIAYCNAQQALASETAANPGQHSGRGALDPGSLGVGTASGAGQAAERGAPFVLGVLLLLLLGALVFVSRYLRPNTAAAVWSRARTLASLGGIDRRPAETPLEFGERVAREIPEAAGLARELAGRFAVAAYAPRELAQAAREPLLDAWVELRPHLVRRIGRRLRPA